MKHAIATRKVEDLVPFDRNSRTHSEAQIAQLATSIKEFGFTNPILVDEDNTIIAGEGRWRAATKLKLSEVPCIVLVGLSAQQKAAYVIADNKLALNSGWDVAKLNAELASLAELEFAVDLTGFSEVEAMVLSKKEAAKLPTMGAATTVPAMEPEAITKPEQKDWSGMPEFKQDDKSPFRTLLVHFEDQVSVDEFAALVGQKLSAKTKFISFPKNEKTPTSTEVYA